MQKSTISVRFFGRRILQQSFFLARLVCKRALYLWGFFAKKPYFCRALVLYSPGGLGNLAAHPPL